MKIQKFIGLLNQLILTSIKHSRFLVHQNRLHEYDCSGTLHNPRHNSILGLDNIPW